VTVADDLREVYQTFDLALRIGEVVLSSGAAASDAAVSMMAITSAAGLRGADISVTFTELSISWQPSPYSPPETHIRNVKFRGLNYEKLTAVDHLVREIVAGRIALEDARKQLDQIVSAPYPYPRWASTLGWGVMAAGVGLLIGGGPLTMLAAFIAAVAIDISNRRLTRQRIPLFYQQVLGGFIATMGAIGLHVLTPESNVSQVVAAGIIVLLSGIAFVGAVQDAVTGYYITATARSFEALLLTGGAIYRGLYKMMEGDVLGISSLAGAVVIAVALASGVILGEYIAQPLKREARRLETKMSGPRLVGPLRVRRSRREERERRRRERAKQQRERADAVAH
jgi:uncharacterized membrane protein YjjP (DUF1212 family)